jgi:hypothetical protein
LFLRNLEAKLLKSENLCALVQAIEPETATWFSGVGWARYTTPRDSLADWWK